MSSINIFVDTQRLRNLNSGLGQLCVHLGRELSRYASKEMGFTFYVPKPYLGFFGPNVSYRAVSIWDKIFKINSKPYQIWHCTHQDSKYFPSNRQTKLVLTILDLNFLERPDYSDAKKRAKLAAVQRKINRADALTVISEYTASVVRQHLTIPNIPLRVIYTGNPMTQPITPTPVKTLEGVSFLFTIGIVHPKKNFHVLLPLLQAHPELTLAIAGNDTHAYTQSIREQAQALGVSERLCFLGAVSESTKYWLYQHCKAFVFPSLSEGFGLPVAEAMSLGKPVFLSNLTSLPEVGGSVAYYWENFEPVHLVKVFEVGITDFNNNPAKAEQLKQQAARFSWQKAAEDYVSLYRELL